VDYKGILEELFMNLKRIICLAIMICFGYSVLFAQSTSPVLAMAGSDNKVLSNIGATLLIIGGGAIAAAPFFLEDYSEPPMNYVLWGVGGLTAIFGIGLIISNIVDSSNSKKSEQGWYAAKNENPILNHLSVDISPSKVFVGGKLSF
jgi:hypothetical protein